MKAFIFTELFSSTQRHADIIVKTFREALYWHIPLALEPVGSMFLQGLFICLCFQAIRKLIINNAKDKGVCNRYTLIQKIIGTSNSRYRGEQISLFHGGLFLLSFYLLIFLRLFYCFIFLSSFVNIQL